MTESQKMYECSKRANIPNFEHYHLTARQLDGLIKELRDEPFHKGILHAVFCYGLSRGYRAAKAEEVRS